MKQPFTRRDFFRGAVAGAGLAALGANAQTPVPKIAGFDETDTGKLKNTVWKPVSDRKVKVGIAGYGVCKFGAQFGFQNHPNVEVVAATDLDPERCAELRALRASIGLTSIPAGTGQDELWDAVPVCKYEAVHCE